MKYEDIPQDILLLRDTVKDLEKQYLDKWYEYVATLTPRGFTSEEIELAIANYEEK